MTKIIIAAVIVMIMGGLVALANYGAPVEAENEKLDIATSTVEAVEEVDVVDSAKAELERINIELDAEETRLMEERDVIDSKLEKIRETRMSF